MIFARRNNKIPEFYMIFARKNARILHNNCQKNIFPDFLFLFLGGGGHVTPAPPFPTPMFLSFSDAINK